MACKTFEKIQLALDSRHKKYFRSWLQYCYGPWYLEKNVFGTRPLPFFSTSTVLWTMVHETSNQFFQNPIPTDFFSLAIVRETSKSFNSNLESCRIVFTAVSLSRNYIYPLFKSFKAEESSNFPLDVLENILYQSFHSLIRLLNKVYWLILFGQSWIVRPNIVRYFITAQIK